MRDMISRDDVIAHLEAGMKNLAEIGSDREAIAAVSGCISAIRALPAYEVGVKPLEWNTNSDYRPDGLIARDHSGFWTVHQSDDFETFEWADPYGRTMFGFSTTDMAIASLEKERAARICSALTATPAQDFREHSGDTDCSVTARAAIARMKEDKE